jgi:hypothetical protein
MFVIKRNDDGLYLARPGQLRSYTNKLDEAWKFHSGEFAAQEKRGNETVVHVGCLSERYRSEVGRAVMDHSPRTPFIRS